MSTMFEGKNGVDLYVATVIKSAIKLYAKTGIRPNRAYTPSAMKAKAEEITGKKFKRGQWDEMVAALEECIAEYQENDE